MTEHNIRKCFILLTKVNLIGALWEISTKYAWINMNECRLDYRLSYRLDSTQPLGLIPANIRFGEYILKTSWRVFSLTFFISQDLLKTSWRHLEDILKTSRRRCLVITSGRRLWSFAKKSWRRLGRLETGTLKSSSRRWNILGIKNVCWEVIDDW